MGNKLDKAKSQGFAKGVVQEQQNKPLRPVQKQGAKELKLNYQIDNNTKNLGQGTFGKVFLSYNKHNPDNAVAIKVLNLSKLNKSDPNSVQNILQEVTILTQLDHPNIVKFYETYIDDKYIYLVQEYIGGGELFDKIADQEN